MSGCDSASAAAVASAGAAVSASAASASRVAAMTRSWRCASSSADSRAASPSCSGVALRLSSSRLTTCTWHGDDELTRALAHVLTRAVSCRLSSRSRSAKCHLHCCDPRQRRLPPPSPHHGRKRSPRAAWVPGKQPAWLPALQTRCRSACPSTPATRMAAARAGTAQACALPAAVNMLPGKLLIQKHGMLASCIPGYPPTSKSYPLHQVRPCDPVQCAG
jgi:hypothetical protein